MVVCVLKKKKKPSNREMAHNFSRFDAHKQSFCCVSQHYLLRRIKMRHKGKERFVSPVLISINKLNALCVHVLILKPLSLD
jgi:hypothetical protein